MISVNHKTRLIRVCALSIMLSIAFESMSASLERLSAQDKQASGAMYSSGDGWRLPTDDEWRQLAKRYGGVFEDSDDGGKAGYKALLSGGDSGFNALLGGGRSEDGRYARLEAHGFYWTASESDRGNAWFYNFGHGGLALYRQSKGEKPRAFSVRCVRE